jgi:thiosulfate/3-mercaptopyruvate sulfurtransferase
MCLISQHDLTARLGKPDCVIVDCRFDLASPEAGRTAWAQAHVPGARYAHLDEDLAAPPGATGGRHPLPDAGALAAAFARWGIGPETEVVAYDDAGGAIAGRLWWLLRWCGHERVAVLDGGWRGWLAAGLPREATASPPTPGPWRALQTGQMPVVDADALAAGLRAGAMLLIDVRAAARFAGQSEPLDRVAGHVPGAVNLPLTGNLAEAGLFLPAAALAERFQAVLGGRPPADAVVMCGSGVSACQTLLAMEHARLSGAALYPGSWSDWISDDSRPVATG